MALSVFWYIPSCDIKDGFSAVDAAQRNAGGVRNYGNNNALDGVHKMHKECEAFDQSEGRILSPLQHGDSTIREQREIIV